MFIGNHLYKVDKKGRVAIPPEFRSELGGEIVLIGIGDGCLTGYSVAEFEKLAKTYGSQPTHLRKVRQVNRLIFSNAFRLQLDTLGRVLLPQPLRKYAQIEDEAVVVGNNTYIEIWSAKSWQAKSETLDDSLLETLTP